MWVLVVEGVDDDYAALQFEQSKWTTETALEDPRGLQKYLAEECGCEEASVSAYEYKNVDPDFVRLIENNFIDYDLGKQSNFYCYWDKDA